MKVHAIAYDQIKIAENRQRQEFDYQSIAELAGSIAQNGLLSPLVVRRGEGQSVQLVAGERRLRALDYLWTAFGESLRCGGSSFPEYMVPCIHLGDLSETDAFEVELEENIRRVDLSWQERAAAIAKLKKLRDEQAKAAGKPEPLLQTLAAEANPQTEILDSAMQATKNALMVARHLDDEEVRSAKTLYDAVKIVQKKAVKEADRALAQLIGKTFSSADHTLLKGSCLDLLPELPAESFDCISAILPTAWEPRTLATAEAEPTVDIFMMIVMITGSVSCVVLYLYYISWLKLNPISICFVISIGFWSFGILLVLLVGKLIALL